MFFGDPEQKLSLFLGEGIPVAEEGWGRTQCRLPDADHPTEKHGRGSKTVMLIFYDSVECIQDLWSSDIWSYSRIRLMDHRIVVHFGYWFRFWPITSHYFRRKVNGSIPLLVQFLVTPDVEPLSGFDCISHMARLIRSNIWSYILKVSGYMVNPFNAQVLKDLTVDNIFDCQCA